MSDQTDPTAQETAAPAAPAAGDQVVRSDLEWRTILDPARYAILREAATERPFTGAYVYSKDTGIYQCGACGNPLFTSDTKYDSGCGWPSFYEPITPGAVTYLDDVSLGMVRTEVRCGRCASHLGHVFPDGPQPTGQRYCMNSLALDLQSGD